MRCFVTVLDLQRFKENKDRARKEVARRIRKYTYRLLRTAGPFIAKETYHCDYCISPIEAGDQYDRETYVNCNHFWTKRRHRPDCFAPTEEEVREIQDELECERQSELDEAEQCA